MVTALLHWPRKSFTLLAVLSLLSCSPKTTSCPPTGLTLGNYYTAQPEQQQYWWHVHIGVHWPENTAPDWSVDALLANEVFAPILSKTQVTPFLWRFHRRAKRDSAGQNFSFLFYTTVPEAQKIFDETSRNPVLKSLLTKGILDQVRLDDIASPTLPRIEDTSDRTWPGALQRAWPAFAMGASAAWLSLVEEAVNQEHVDRNSPENLLSTYQKVSSTVDNTWHDNGQHAFFHHLSAIFGYAAIEIKTELQF